MTSSANSTLKVGLVQQHAFNDKEKSLSISEQGLRELAAQGCELAMLQELARNIATVQAECSVEINVEEYVDSFKPTLMDLVYKWVSQPYPQAEHRLAGVDWTMGSGMKPWKPDGGRVFYGKLLLTSRNNVLTCSPC